MYIRRRNPIARLVSVVILIVALIIGATRVKHAIDAGNSVQSEANRLSKLSEGGLGSSYLIPKNLEHALASLRAKIGSDAPLIEVQLEPTAVEFQYVVGQRAAGFTANTVRPELVPEEVTLSGSGSPRAQSFPLSVVRATVPPQLVRAIRRRPGLSDFKLNGATLEKQPGDNRLGWSIVGTGGGHDVIFLARPNGTGLRRLPQ